MKLLDRLFKGKNVKDVLKNVDLKEIKEEIAYLELQEKKLEAERQELEKEAEKLFQDSIGKSEATKRANAIKIKNIKDRIADIDKDLREINLRLGVLYKIQRLKEKAQETYGSKVWDELINNVDSETLTRWLIDQNIEAEEIMGKLRQLYEAQAPDMKEEELSKEEKEILEAMNAVEKGEKTPEEAVKHVTTKKEEEKDAE